jgi:NAD+ kinase
VLTPICPHILTKRSLVDAAEKTFQIQVRQASVGNVLIVDGHEQTALTPSHRVVIRQAPVQFRLIKVPGRSYYRTLRDKLNWHAPPQYRNDRGLDDRNAP